MGDHLITPPLPQGPMIGQRPWGFLNGLTFNDKHEQQLEWDNDSALTGQTCKWQVGNKFHMLHPHHECLVRYLLISMATLTGIGGFQKKGLWWVSYICMQWQPSKYLPTISIPPYNKLTYLLTNSIFRHNHPVWQEGKMAVSMMTGCAWQAISGNFHDLLVCHLVSRTFMDMCTPHVFKVVRVRVPQNQQGINAFWNLFGDKKQKLGRHVHKLMYQDGDKNSGKEC